MNISGGLEIVRYNYCWDLGNGRLGRYLYGSMCGYQHMLKLRCSTVFDNVQVNIETTTRIINQSIAEWTQWSRKYHGAGSFPALAQDAEKG
ncbi:hypothetical protein C5167_039963 [Papaver somniferum]|uniref:Uncharacterized protein n=1 Tax=Papaver somniferum TaxID=3469 RepID=A0A4Y7IH24_PAPSO|nr:hypothetical protein C5167_039963 [Papaver somniferum]